MAMMLLSVVSVATDATASSRPFIVGEGFLTFSADISRLLGAHFGVMVMPIAIPTGHCHAFSSCREVSNGVDIVPFW